MASLLTLLNVELSVPDHTTLSRRSVDFEVSGLNCRTRMDGTDGPLHVIIDSTGMRYMAQANGFNTNMALNLLANGVNCTLLLMQIAIKGYVAKISVRQSVADRWTQLCCKFCELLFERKWFRCCKDALLLAHHVNEFDARKCDAGSSFGLEAEHASYPPFDTAMILFNGIIHVFTGADSDGVTSL